MDTTDVLARQQEYYDGRADDWPRWIAHYVAPVEDRLDEALGRCALDGDVLDMACGTGFWTAKLARRAASVTALDGSAAMLAGVEALGLPNVHPLRADLFDWHPPTQWDAVFFANWLAHVPELRFDAFWATVDAAMLPGGRAVVVDVASEERRIEEEVVEHEELGPITRRRLKDGRRYDVVKRYWEPDELLARLEPLGWKGEGTKIGEEHGMGFVVWKLHRIEDGSER